MIGFFDSGFGGLQTMKYFQDLYPQYDYMFLADSKNCPFGNKNWEDIKQLTFNWIQRLFDHWAQIVILACNTAAAYAVRNRQTQYPDKKVLSITIPGVEKILTNEHNNKKIGILATQATILSNIYTDLFHKFGGNHEPDFEFVMAPKLVEIIEWWETNQEEIDFAVQEHINKFHEIDTLILGCTHFPILSKSIKKFFIGEIIDPSKEAATQFGRYLERHPEIEEKLTTLGQTKYFTTWSSQQFSTIWSRIAEKKITAEQVNLT